MYTRGIHGLRVLYMLVHSVLVCLFLWVFLCLELHTRGQPVG